MLPAFLLVILVFVDASVDALLAGWQPHTQGQTIVRFGSAAADLTRMVAETEPYCLTSLG